MISREEKVINQLLGCIYTDSKDKTAYRINMDSALKLLIANDFIIPVKQYEAALEIVLQNKIVGKAVVHMSTKYVIAKAMYQLAAELAVSKDEILKYEMMNKEDIINQKD